MTTTILSTLLFLASMLYTAISIFCFAVILSIGFTAGRYVIAKYAPRLVTV